MGGFLSSLIASPLKDILSGVSGILDKFVVSPEEKLKAQQEILKLQSDLQVKILELDGEFAKQQAAVITAEASSESWLARNWRPILMLVFTYIIAHNYVIAPLFGAASVPIPEQMWRLLELGITGYVAGRSLEKIVPSVAEVLSNKK